MASLAKIETHHDALEAVQAAARHLVAVWESMSITDRLKDPSAALALMTIPMGQLQAALVVSSVHEARKTGRRALQALK